MPLAICYSIYGISIVRIAIGTFFFHRLSNSTAFFDCSDLITPHLFFFSQNKSTPVKRNLEKKKIYQLGRENHCFIMASNKPDTKGRPRQSSNKKALIYLDKEIQKL